MPFEPQTAVDRPVFPETPHLLLQLVRRSVDFFAQRNRPELSMSLRRIFLLPIGAYRRLVGETQPVEAIPFAVERRANGTHGD